MTGNSLSHAPSTPSHLLLQVNAAGTLKTLTVDVAPLKSHDLRLLRTLSHLQNNPILEVGSMQLPDPITLDIQPYVWDETRPASEHLQEYLEANRQLARRWQHQLNQENGHHISLACILGGLVLICVGQLVSGTHPVNTGMLHVLMRLLSNDITRMLMGLGLALYGFLLMLLHSREKPALLDPAEECRIRKVSHQILHPRKTTARNPEALKKR